MATRCLWRVSFTCAKSVRVFIDELSFMYIFKVLNLQVIHSDIKPSNILVSSEGRALLTDFGGCCQQGQPRAVKSYTPGYAAPEEFTEVEITTQYDVFYLDIFTWYHNYISIKQRITIRRRYKLSRCCRKGKKQRESYSP